jgi:uncharacterized protein (DUF983 family)
MPSVPQTPVIPKSSVATKFVRALGLGCPRCGSHGILRHWFKMQDHCPGCGLALERGESSDFWIGAYVFNLAGGELLAIGIPVIWVISSSPNPPWGRIQALAIVLAIVMPLFLFPFSRTLWLAWDLSFRPFEPGDIGRVQ